MPTTKCGFENAPGVSGAQYLVSVGPTLFVHIGFDPNFDPTAKPFKPAALPADIIWALVDTGALESCIDSDLAMRLNLPVIDRREVSGVHGQREVNVHLAQVHVPSLTFVLHGQFCAVDLAAGGQQHRALIGRTFLQHFTMVYEGRTGTVTLSNDPDVKS
jgi:hypothetical protein